MVLNTDRSNILIKIITIVKNFDFYSKEEIFCYTMIRKGL